LDHEIDHAIEIDTGHVGAVLLRPAMMGIVRDIEAFLAKMEGRSPAMNGKPSRGIDSAH